MVGILLHVELLEKSNFELIDTTFAIVHFKQIDLLAVNNPMQRFFVFFFLLMADYLKILIFSLLDWAKTKNHIWFFFISFL